MRNSRRCSRCGSLVVKSGLPQYSYQCFKCDEDLFAFETTGNGVSLKYLLWEAKRALQRILSRDHPLIFQIDQEAAKLILGSGEEGGDYEPRGRYYLQDGDKWVGIDNSTGEAWTEEFPSKRKCLRWLKGCERLDES